MAKTGVVVADLHVGSYYGLCTPKVPLPKGGTYTPSANQDYLIEIWKRCLRRAPKELDFVIFNGDLIDGGQWKDGGSGLIITSPMYQKEICYDVINPLLRRAKKVFVTRGTRYHENKDDMEKFAKDIGAKAGKDGIRCRPVTRVRAGDVYLEARHKISGAWLYTLSALQREHRADKEAAERKGYSADLMVGAHRHQYNFAGGWGWYCVTVPCMELQTDWAEEKQPNLWIPDLGMVVVHLYPGNKKRGLPAVSWEPIIYPHPLPEVFSL